MVDRNERERRRTAVGPRNKCDFTWRRTVPLYEPRYSGAEHSRIKNQALATVLGP